MATTARSGHSTTDHDFIRGWVEERGGRPARVKETATAGEDGVLRIDFPGYAGGDSLETIEWDDWFRGFEENKLAFLHRDLTHKDGELDRFNKLVARGKATAKSSRGRAVKTAASTTRARKTGTRKTAPRKRPASRRSAEEMSELRDLLLHELGDLLFAERKFLVATRGMVAEAREKRLRTRLEAHVGETATQIERLQEAFGALGERPRAVKCDGAIGLKEEHDSFKREEKPSEGILAAFDLGSGLRVEHYEIAGYKSAIALAGVLGETACADLLRASLKEEEAMASFLEKNAPMALRRTRREELGQNGGIMGTLRRAVGM